jgi:hypothetical protein
VIRSLVDELLQGNERATNERWERALAVVGRFRSGRRDIGRNHDRYLAEDFHD